MLLSKTVVPKIPELSTYSDGHVYENNIVPELTPQLFQVMVL